MSDLWLKAIELWNLDYQLNNAGDPTEFLKRRNELVNEITEIVDQIVKENQILNLKYN